jgi:phospholipase C
MPSVSITNYNWTSEHPRFVADLNGDGRADVVGIGPDCVWSCLNRDGLGFSEPTFAIVAFEANAGWRIGDHPRFVMDLTGDGRADIIGFGDGGAWVCLGNGDGSFQEARLVLQELGFNQGWRVDKHPRFVEDLTGDGRADIVGFGNDGVWVSLGNGDGSFQPARFVLREFGFNQGWRVDGHPRFVTDLTGDGRADIVGFGNDGIWVSLGNGDGSFQPARFVLQEFGFNQGWRVDHHPRFVTDLTGDGRADIVGFGNDGVWVSLGNGDGSFQPARFVLSNLGANAGWRVDDHPRFVADVNGDGKPDLVAFGDDGIWVAFNNGDGTFQEARFVLADLGRRSNHDRIVRKEIIRDHRQRGRIKHVFVLMLENRSYDHMLGFAEFSGTDAATGEPTTADGLKGTEFNCFSERQFKVVRGAPDVCVDPGHSFKATLEQLCGKHAKFSNGGPYPEVNNTGFVSNMAEKRGTDRASEIMRCFVPEHLPILTTLAREFAVCDRWFCSMPGPTEPNRMFLHAATSGDFDDRPSNFEVAEASTNPFGGYEFEGGTIFDAMKEADVNWRIYAGDNFPVVGELDGISNTFDVRDFEDFAKDLQDQDFDAALIHIEPDYFGGLRNIPHFEKGNSQHPDGGVAAGERLIKATYEAIRNSPHWESSMLIVTYDEHGGFYDHVAPGAAVPTGSTGRNHGFKFDQLGPRVPAVVVSPLIPKSTIEHRLLEHCSVVATIMDLFDVPPLRHARNLREICGLSHLAQLSQPRDDTPERLPQAVVSDVPSSAVAVLNALARPLSDEEMIATAVRVAAIEEIGTLEPERRAEIVSRVSNMRTRAEAVAFLAEVEAKIEAARPH